MKFVTFQTMALLNLHVVMVQLYAQSGKLFINVLKFLFILAES